MSSKSTVAAILGVVFIGGLIMFGPELREHFGTRYADADREVFENSKPYVHASIQNLNRLRFEYDTAETNTQRMAIRLSPSLYCRLYPTYVLCITSTGDTLPVYSEPKLIVSPFELKYKTSLVK